MGYYIITVWSVYLASYTCRPKCLYLWNWRFHSCNTPSKCLYRIFFSWFSSLVVSFCEILSFFLKNFLINIVYDHSIITHSWTPQPFEDLSLLSYPSPLVVVLLSTSPFPCVRSPKKIVLYILEDIIILAFPSFFYIPVSH